MNSPFPSAGTRLGDFEIVRELGRGGMGVVYEARQLSLNRAVALKILPPRLGMTSTARQRFHREAQAAAKLHHGHIVEVYAEGEEEGTCYYAMELVPGHTLDQLISSQRVVAPTLAKQSTDGDTAATVAEVSAVPTPQPRTVTDSDAARFSRDHLDDLARWVADVADALEYAHRQGIVHRDVKPSNVILGEDGRVRLMDFGLARVQEEPGMTISGEILGTPRYMSPEQITAGRMKIDHRTDVYSLGATLYELLTLQPPFPGESRDQIISQIISKDARPLRQIDRRIPTDLETICMKAIEKDPDRRYQTAAEFSDDLRRFVKRYTIAAHRVGPLGRALKWIHRRPAAAALAVCAVCAVVAVAIMAQRTRDLAQRRLVQLRETAIVQTTSGNFPAAAAAIDEAETRGLSEDWMYLLRGQAAIRQGDTNEAVRYFEQALRMSPNSGAARAMLHYGYLVSGNYTKYLEGIHELESIELSTFEDFLFAGQAVAHANPEWGLQLLAKASEFRKTPLGYRTSAEIRMQQGWVNGDVALVEQAVQEATIAEDMLEDPLDATCIRLCAHLNASTVYRHVGRGEDARRHLELAGQLDVALPEGEHRGLPTQFLARGFYLDYLQRDEESYEFYRQIATSDHFMALKLAFYALYRQQRDREALEIVEHIAEYGTGDSIEISAAFVRAELEGPAAARTAFAELAAAAQQADSLPYFPTVHVMEILLLLGQTAEAQQFLLDLRDRIRSNPLDPEWFEQLLTYLCGQLDGEQLLELAASNLARQLDAHFYLGLRELSQGRRAAAAEHFRSASDVGVPPHYEWYWSRGFLRRLEEDPAWPHWIGAK